MSNKIITYCTGIPICCGNTCWCCTHIETLCNQNNIEYQEATASMIDFYGLNLSPTILFLQDGVVFKTIYGVMMENEIEKVLKILRWV